MRAEIVIPIIVGIIFLFIGSIIRKGNIHVIHDYHTRGVKKKDRMEYARVFSKGMYTFAIMLFCCALVFYLGYEILVPICFLIFGIIGMYFINKAQKYNGGWFDFKK